MKVLLILFLVWSGTSASATQDNGSCKGRCGYSNGECACNTSCKSNGNCCSDYTSVCYSCEGRCDEGYLSTKPCQCNSGCTSHYNCCNDYTSVCKEGPATDAEVMALTEELYKLDEPLLVKHLITYDPSPPGPLFTYVDPEALKGPTILAFIPLRDNYNPSTAIAEEDDSQEMLERENFLDAIMATDVMKRTESFLTEHSMINKPLKEVINEIFFTRYPRDGNTLGSSGFEHSFLGEIDDGQVKGFHNWISFYENEQSGDLQYTSYIDEEDIGKELDLFMMGFNWYDYRKPISSMFIGSTPELELALYTVCFYHRPNELCEVSMNSVKYFIQTYTQYYNGGTYVGSAYPDI